MKQIRIAAAGLALAALACTTAVLPNAVRGSGNIVSQSFDVPEFSGISLNTIGTVEFVQGEPQSVVIETDDNILRALQVNVENGLLVLSDKGSLDLVPTQDITYRITAKGVSNLRVDSSGRIRADRVDAASLQLGLDGSGSIRVQDAYAGDCGVDSSGSGSISVGELECDSVDVKLSASGAVTLGGTTGELKVNSSGSGEALLADLQAKNAGVDMNASGSVTIWAVETLIAKLSGSGSLSYYGDPDLTSSVSGSGGIKPLGAR